MIIIILSVLLALFVIATGALIYACRNLLKKIEVYEDWVDMFREEVNGIYAKLKLVDEKNLFEKDDDVGFVFSEVVRVMNEFNDKVK